MMAPYAVAHMKLAMVLKETDYDFSGGERVNVFLTNSLEEASNSSKQVKLWDDPLATEAIDASETKKNQGINIVIGNPSYSGESANKNEWIMRLIDEYKKEPGGVVRLQERNPKWINDDYVKFIRYAQTFIERAGAGVVAYINPHGFLDNPTFRGDEVEILLSTFNKIYVIDLHGNAKKAEICPDGSKDENVFDIQQGVCIILMIRSFGWQEGRLGEVFHMDIWGEREYKYKFLDESILYKLPCTRVFPTMPYFYMLPKDFSFIADYSCGFSISDVFQINSVGIVSANDKVLINFDMD